MSRTVKFLPRLALAAVALLAPAAPRPAFASYTYVLTDLGTLPGGTNAEAFGINPQGQIAGRSGSTMEGGHGFVFTPTAPNGTTGSLFDIGTLGGTSSTAVQINASGQVVGRSLLAGDAVNHAFLSTPGQTLTAANDLNTIAGTQSQGFGLNDAGQAVGFAQFTAGGPYHPFLTAPNGKIIAGSDLSTLGGANGYAFGVNAGGSAVGYSETATGALHAFVWVPTTANGPTGAIHDLGTLGGTTSFANSINTAGQIVGNAQLANGDTHAALFSAGGAPVDLGVLGTGTYALALGINNHGVIVGQSSIAPGAFSNTTTHAFVDTGSGLQDLNSLIAPGSGFTLNAARGINDLGQIVGFGVDSDGFSHAFLLTLSPVPEPAAFALFGAGLALVAVSRASALRRRATA